MKRDFLKELGIDEEAINKIMAENGKDINNAKGEVEKTAAELEQTKKDLAAANETLEKFKDYDVIKSDVEKYKADAEKSKAEYEKKIKTMELETRVKDFTSSKKFVNDLTRDSINNSLIGLLNDDTNAGKSLDELLNGLTDGKENIFVNENTPKPPVTPDLKGGNADNESGVMAAFRRLNPNINI